jgi:hypothetical protein
MTLAAVAFESLYVNGDWRLGSSAAGSVQSVAGATSASLSGSSDSQFVVVVREPSRTT